MSVRSPGPLSAPPTPQRDLTGFCVIVPTALHEGPDRRPLVATCLEGLMPAFEELSADGTGGRGFVLEVVLVTQGREFRDPVLAKLAPVGVRILQVDVPGPFNFSKKVNAGAAAASGSVLLLLNDDAYPRGRDWPAVILEVLADETVGAVGPMIVNPDGTLNSAGDALSPVGPRHVDAFDVRYRPGLAQMMSADRDVTLLTGAALAVPMTLFHELGGFDEAYPESYGDSDFCLRVRESGRRLICSPRMTVVHRESSSRDPNVAPETLRRFRRAHADAFREDPLLPPLAIPARTRIARALAPHVRSIYTRAKHRLRSTRGRQRGDGDDA